MRSPHARSCWPSVFCISRWPAAIFPPLRTRQADRNVIVCVVQNGQKEDESKGERRKPIKAKWANGNLFSPADHAALAIFLGRVWRWKNSVAIGLRDLTFSEISSPLLPHYVALARSLAHALLLAFILKVFSLFSLFFAHLRFCKLPCLF